MSRVERNRLDGIGVSKKIFVGDTDTAMIIRLFNTSDDVFDPLVDPTPPVLDISAAVPGVDLMMRFLVPAEVSGDSPTIQDVPATFATVTTLPGFTGDGEDGYIEYRTASGFIVRSGAWRREGFPITLAPGTWASEIIDFEVFDHL